jgi:hypothetical protein
MVGKHSLVGRIKKVLVSGKARYPVTLNESCLFIMAITAFYRDGSVVMPRIHES